MSCILLATHGGPSAEGAARVAAALARRLGVPLRTLTVLPPTPPMDYGYGPVIPPDEAADEQGLARLTADCTAQLDRCGGELAGGAPTAVLGPPVAVIAAEARRCGAEAIVVGLGPHHLVDRALGGETALRLTQTSRVPVLAVPADATTLPRCAVAAVDYGATSLAAARLAARWLRAGDTLHLLHVDDGSARPGGPTAAPAVARLDALARELEVAPGVTVETIEASGDPARALLDVVARRRAELIALGSHGYGAWQRLVLGSVASKVIRVGTCSVLVVPAGTAGEAATTSGSARAQAAPAAGGR